MFYILGVKPQIHQSEPRTYTKVVPLKEKKFLSLCCIAKNIEWNVMDFVEPKFDGFISILIPLWRIYASPINTEYLFGGGRGRAGKTELVLK